MKVVAGHPPIYDNIVAALGRPPANTVYTWGDTMYVADPTQPIDRPLLAHESVHRRQQAAGGGPYVWWANYLTNRNFRLAQEVEAYQEQWACARTMGMNHDAARPYLRALAKDLSGRLYGHLVSFEDARALIRGAGK